MGTSQDKFQCQSFGRPKHLLQFLLLGLLGASVFCETGSGIGISSQPANQNLQMAEIPRFWNKPEVQETLQAGRKIVVSVTRDSDSWNFRGAGVVDIPSENCIEQAKNFSLLERFPEHFSQVLFNQKDSVLALKVKFLGKDHPLSLRLAEVRVLDKSKNWLETQIFFRNQESWLMGFEGVLLISKGLTRQETLVGILGQYRGPPSWVPDWIFAVAAEAVMHHVSLSLRNTLEKDYKK